MPMNVSKRESQDSVSFQKRAALSEYSQLHRRLVYRILAEVPGVARGKFNPILIHAWKIFFGLENMWKILISWASQWGVPPCKLFVDGLEKWTLFGRNKAQNEAKRFRILLFQSLLTEKITTTKCTSYCSNNAEFWFLTKKRGRQILYHRSFFHQHEKSTPTEQWMTHSFSNQTNCSWGISHSKHLREIFSLENGFLFDTDYPEELRAALLCFGLVRLHISTTLVPSIQCRYSFR